MNIAHGKSRDNFPWLMAVQTAAAAGLSDGQKNGFASSPENEPKHQNLPILASVSRSDRPRSGSKKLQARCALGADSEIRERMPVLDYSRGPGKTMFKNSAVKPPVLMPEEKTLFISGGS